MPKIHPTNDDIDVSITPSSNVTSTHIGHPPNWFKQHVPIEGVSAIANRRDQLIRMAHLDGDGDGDNLSLSAAFVKGNEEINNSSAASEFGLGPPHTPQSKGGKKSRRVKSRKVRRVKTRKTRVNRRRKTSRK